MSEDTLGLSSAPSSMSFLAPPTVSSAGSNRTVSYTHLDVYKRQVIDAFGGRGFRAENMEQLAEAFSQALKFEGPSWIDCNIAEDDLVLPMIQNGKTVDDIIYE